MKTLGYVVLAALLAYAPAKAGDAVLKDCGQYAPGDGTIAKMMTATEGGNCDFSTPYEWRDTWLGYTVRSWGNKPLGDPQVVTPTTVRKPAAICRMFTPDGMTAVERSTRLHCGDMQRDLPYRIYDFKAGAVTLMPIAVRIGFDKLTDLGRERVEEVKRLRKVAGR